MSIASLYFAFPGRLETLTGGYLYDQQLIQGLRQLGLEVTTLSLSGRFPFPDQQALQEAREALTALPDDALVIIDGLALGAFDEAALAPLDTKRLRVIALCHHPLALESGLDHVQQRCFQRSEQRALQAARAVLVTSDHTRRILITQFAVPPEKVTVARPGTARVPFARCEGQPPRLLALASLTRRKGHDVLIDALAPLRHLPWQARFVGGRGFDPAWSDELQRQVNRLALHSRIDFVGAVENAQAEFQHADLFVLPSRYEGYGMVFAEALAAGLPIVAARAGAVPDVVPESAGLLVPPDNVEALTAALHSLLTSEDLRRQLRAGAREVAGSLPTWADTAACAADVFEEIALS